MTNVHSSHFSVNLSFKLTSEVLELFLILVLGNLKSNDILNKINVRWNSRLQHLA
jgi:hypothetical protein